MKCQLFKSINTIKIQQKIATAAVRTKITQNMVQNLDTPINHIINDIKDKNILILILS